jgi:surfeit locus 1 family protein
MPSRSPGALHVLTRPSMFLLHLTAVAGIAVAVLLGQWQIGAWQEHRTDRAAEIADDEPVPLAEVMGPDDGFPSAGVGRPVRVSGAWLPESTVYVAERQQGGETGYWAVTPLSTCLSGSCADVPAIPVVLGWSASPNEAPAPPTGTAEVTGWLQPGEGSEVDEDPLDDVLPSLRIADLLQRVDRDLYGAYVIAETPTELHRGLTPVTPESLPKPETSTALRNLLYGLEWWCFAGFAVFLWWRWCRDEVVAARIPSEV